MGEDGRSQPGNLHQSQEAVSPETRLSESGNLFVRVRKPRNHFTVQQQKEQEQAG